MEISNKTFGVFCVAIVGITVYVRAQSVQSEVKPVAVAAKTEAVEPARKIKRPIPNSTLPPDPFASTPVDQPVVDETPVIVGDVPGAAPQTVAPGTPNSVAETTPSPSADETAAAEEDLSYLDDIGDMASAVPTDNSVEIADRNMFRVIMNTMTNTQRDAFRMMWFTMSPDERLDFLAQLRGEQQGG